MKKVIFVIMSFIISLFGFSNNCNAQTNKDLVRDFINNFEGTYEFEDDSDRLFELVLIYNYNTEKYLGVLYDLQGKELTRGEVYNYQCQPINNSQFIRTAVFNLGRKAIQVCYLDRKNGNNNFITKKIYFLKFEVSPNSSTVYVKEREKTTTSGNFRLRKIGDIKESRRKSLIK